MGKAQVAGQILIYILAIVIFGLTLLYGYKAVKYFTEKSEEISFLQLEHDIQAEIEKVKGDTMGTIKRKVLTIPGNYDHVCFVKSYPSFPPSIDTLDLNYNLIESHINNGAEDKNMFLAPPGDVSFFVGDKTNKQGIALSGTKDVDCIDIVGSKIELKLESMGNHVKISRWG